jgi:type II secretory pathway component PulC
MAGLVAPALAADAPPWRLAATLTQPGSAAALIEHDGQQWWLRPGDDLGACRLVQVKDSSAAFDCDSGPLLLRLAQGQGDGMAPAPVAAVEHIILPPGTLQLLASRPQAVVRAIEMRPEVYGDAVVGWRIARLDEAGSLGGLGLQEADLLVDVNGFPANEPGRFVAALRDLPEQGAFTLDVLRDGQPLRLQVIAPPE